MHGSIIPGKIRQCLGGAYREPGVTVSTVGTEVRNIKSLLFWSLSYWDRETGTHVQM